MYRVGVCILYLLINRTMRDHMVTENVNTDQYPVQSGLIIIVMMYRYSE